MSRAKKRLLIALAVPAALGLVLAAAALGLAHVQRLPASRFVEVPESGSVVGLVADGDRVAVLWFRPPKGVLAHASSVPIDFTVTKVDGTTELDGTIAWEHAPEEPRGEDRYEYAQRALRAWLAGEDLYVGAEVHAFRVNLSAVRAARRRPEFGDLRSVGGRLARYRGGERRWLVQLGQQAAHAVVADQPTSVAAFICRFDPFKANKLHPEKEDLPSDCFVSRLDRETGKQIRRVPVCQSCEVLAARQLSDGEVRVVTVPLTKFPFGRQPVVPTVRRLGENDEVATVATLPEVWRRGVRARIGPAGQIAFAGSFEDPVPVGGKRVSSAGGEDGYVVVYDESGKARLVHTVGGPYDDVVMGADFDESGKLLVLTHERMGELRSGVFAELLPPLERLVLYEVGADGRFDEKLRAVGNSAAGQSSCDAASSTATARALIVASEGTCFGPRRLFGSEGRGFALVSDVYAFRPE